MLELTTTDTKHQRPNTKHQTWHWRLILLSLVIYSCGNSAKPNFNTPAKNKIKTIHIVKTYQYDSLAAPQFFKSLTKNHIKDFIIIDSVEFIRFCLSNNLNVNDSTNINQFFTIKILHDLFTCQTASNCSRGEIVNIPYQWHWVDPNPRYQIYFSHNNKLLKDTDPPEEFSRYNSYADIDRTPYLFLSDFLCEDRRYYSMTCDTFSTFGWCSEREMAFVALGKLLGYESKIVANGNHSWSELLVSMKSNNDQYLYFTVTVDNTFNLFAWDKIETDEIPAWKENFGNSNLAEWYNRKASSSHELEKIRNHTVSNKAMKRIEKKLAEYLKRNIQRIQTQ